MFAPPATAMSISIVCVPAERVRSVVKDLPVSGEATSGV